MISWRLIIFFSKSAFSNNSHRNTIKQFTDDKSRRRQEELNAADYAFSKSSTFWVKYRLTVYVLKIKMA